MTTVTDLETLAYVNYGNFTAMPVCPAGVRGLGLHLERLDRDARILFGHGVDGDEVRARIHAAVQGHELPANVRVTVFVPNLPVDRIDDLPEPEFLVRVRPLVPSRPAAARLRSTRYARDLPQVKHVGTFGLFHQYRLARQAGYDDALFVSADGRISESTVSNVGFYDGSRIVLPAAPALPGIEMRLLTDGLRRHGVDHETWDLRLPDLSGFRSAFMTNVINGATPIAAIDDVRFDLDPALVELLEAAHLSNPLEPLVNGDLGR
nr:aminotransferase class IV [Actinocrispum wychmicini]